MAEKETQREVANVPLNGTAKAIIERIREDTGVPKTEALQRLLEWFAAQDRKFRLAILNRDVGTQKELMQLVLQQMLAGEMSVPKKETTALAHQMINKLELMIEARDAEIELLRKKK